MKTTIDLPDDLLIAAKKRAAELRCSLRSLLIGGLRHQLAITDPRRVAPVTLRWVTAEGGLPPATDLTDREQMSEWIREERSGPDRG